MYVASKTRGMCISFGCRLNELLILKEEKFVFTVHAISVALCMKPREERGEYYRQTCAEPSAAERKHRAKRKIITSLFGLQLLKGYPPFASNH
jgi:hypothetical protein